MADTTRQRRVAVVAALTGAALVLSASSSQVGARPSIVVEQGDAQASASIVAAAEHGAYATVSGDGRYYVFQGLPGALASDLEPAPASDVRTATIYLTDREANLTTELTPVPAELRPGNSVHPVISGDGCSAVIVTELALDVFRDDDTGERWDIYRARLPHCGGGIGGWELISTMSDGSALARDDVTPDQTPAVDRSGTLVAYTHPADRIIDGEGLTTISVVDITVPIDGADRSRIVAGAPITSPDTTFVHAGLDQPAISGDGRFVAYRSDAASSEAVPGWGSGPVDGAAATRQIFVWDRNQADPFEAVTLVSARSDETPATTDSSDPVISRDGRILAFTSNAPDLVAAVYPPCSDVCPTQVYRVDRDVDANGLYDEPGRTSISLVSAEPKATDDADPLIAGTAPSQAPSLTADGQLVAFVTKAANLQLLETAGGGASSDGDVLVADTANATIRRLTVAPDGVSPVVGAHSRPDLSDTGRTVVFDTLAAADLVVGAWPSGRNVVALSSMPSVSLADADLGTTLVGFEGDEWYVAVINHGTSSFLPAEVTVSDRRFRVNEAASTCSLDVSVPPGGDCTVKLTFTPSSPGPVTATLTVAEEGFQAATVSSSVRGAGGDPALRIDEAGGDFGTVAVGASSRELLFDVRNISLLATSVRNVSVEGAHYGDFVISSNNCANRPLNPRATCTVGVTFTPTGAGRRTGVVRFSTQSGQYTTIVVSGDAAFAPTLEFLDGEINAGDDMVLVGQGYPPLADVTIMFGDGTGRPVAARTTDQGALLVAVPVSSRDDGGVRNVVVNGAQNSVASAPITIIPDTDTVPGMPGFGLGSS